MKKTILFLIVLCCSYVLHAQNTYTVNGETYELKTEVNGTLDLLWNIINGEYRYFVKKEDDSIVELTNIKSSDNKYSEAYKATLNNLTQNSNLSTDRLKFTLYDLRNFIDSYNAFADADYAVISKKTKLSTRILLFGGLTNSPFVENPENKSNPLLGAEIEVFEGSSIPKHSLFFQIKHVLSSDDFDYSTTQLGLGYRFRFIRKEAFNVYANVIAATYNVSKSTISYLDEDVVITEERSANSFDVPLIFGIGADIKITENSFITITYDELFAAFLDNQDNFSTHFAIGYKFNL